MKHEREPVPGHLKAGDDDDDDDGRYMYDMKL